MNVFHIMVSVGHTRMSFRHTKVSVAHTKVGVRHTRTSVRHTKQQRFRFKLLKSGIGVQPLKSVMGPGTIHSRSGWIRAILPTSRSRLSVPDSERLEPEASRFGVSDT